MRLTIAEIEAGGVEQSVETCAVIIACRHPNGYLAKMGDDWPDLLESSKGSIAACYGEDGEVQEVKEWTGRRWKTLAGDEREWALSFLEG